MGPRTAEENSRRSLDRAAVTDTYRRLRGRGRPVASRRDMREVGIRLSQVTDKGASGGGKKGSEFGGNRAEGARGGCGRRTVPSKKEQSATGAGPRRALSKDSLAALSLSA
jgi:hypothetical protein